MVKVHLRKLVKKQRAQLSPKELQLISEKVRAKIEQHFDFRGKTTNLFLPIEKFHEIDLFPLIDKIIEIDGTVCINKANFKSNTITPYLYSKQSRLKINSFGIPEPSEGDIVQQKEIDYVIVPLLAFNKKGYRVGYGKGFYDAFLSQCSEETIFIGVNHFNELYQIDDLGNHDIPLDFIITPGKIYKF